MSEGYFTPRGFWLSPGYLLGYSCGCKPTWLAGVTGFPSLQQQKGLQEGQYGL